MTIRNMRTISLFVGLCAASVADAQITISEIMYDPPGADTKREWIEVFNAGSVSVDLATYFLLENNVYHKLVPQSGSTLEPGDFAVIADSVPDVLVDYPDFEGLIFDSAFSLANTGEKLSVTDSQKVAVDEFTYAADMGAGGNRQTLQIAGDTVIHAGATFGTENKTVSEAPDTDDSAGTTPDTSSGSSGGDSSHSQPEPKEAYAPTGPFKIGAGRDRLVLINVPILFNATLSKPEAKPSFAWNLGDFTVRTGRKVTHTYEYPGTYQVVLEARNRDHTAISRTEVTVLAPDIEIVQATTTLAFTNRLSDEVNIGGFRLNFMGGSRRVPENTIIDAGATLTIPRAVDEILTSVEYPNGVAYKSFEPQADLVSLLAAVCAGDRPPLVCKTRQVREVLVQ